MTEHKIMRKAQASIMFNVIIGILISVAIFVVFQMTLSNIEKTRESRVEDLYTLDISDSFLTSLTMIDLEEYESFLEKSKSLEHTGSGLYGNVENFKTFLGDTTIEDQDGDTKYFKPGYVVLFNNDKLYSTPSFLLIRKTYTSHFMGYNQGSIWVQKRFKETLE